MLKTFAFPFTTNAGGAASLVFPKPIRGTLYSVRVAIGTSDATLDVVVADVDKTIFTGTNITASKTYYPRDNSCSLAGVASSDGAIMPDMIGPVTVTIAQGGDTKSGTVTIRYMD